ncbi:NAD kinase [Candidatus Cyrtobacter comes]|uniref:NAD kinase n=1 Tax=Candidatus Cyrtobacter comes TaxID=675776 RepID=A0ABU5L8F8_9RICK|nr:NAD kinase [Candidatus Cyrtobacter comes]MDZ5762407.1 NAD kinase [Candidatus Cyrtobacter comes]
MIGCLFDSDSHHARQAFCELSELYDITDISVDGGLCFDVILTLGGDGMMLRALHKFIGLNIPIFGMNRGSLGFLLNKYSSENMIERIRNSVPVELHPLEMQVLTDDGELIKAIAVNEVSVLRQLHQAANLRIYIDGKLRLGKLVSDGILVSTPAGSSAYNYAAGGNIIPLSANVVALTPISPFRPRSWRSVLLSNKSIIEIEVLEHQKRQISAVADFTEVRNAVKVKIFQRNDIKLTILSDSNDNLEDRMLQEQFYT